MDRRSSGFRRACETARAHGLTPLVRLGGGHAAAYGPGCVIVELIEPNARIAEGLEQRFRELAGLFEELLKRLGVDAEVGELPGEYCPGRYSLHLSGGPKIAGLAQRIVSGAALTTSVLVVDGGPALRDLIRDVYAALELDFDPATAGALIDRHPELSAPSVLAAAIDLLGSRSTCITDEVPAQLAGRAEELAETVAAEPASGLTRG